MRHPKCSAGAFGARSVARRGDLRGSGPLKPKVTSVPTSLLDQLKSDFGSDVTFGPAEKVTSVPKSLSRSRRGRAQSADQRSLDDQPALPNAPKTATVASAIGAPFGSAIETKPLKTGTTTRPGLS